jgi:hypothetical protein
LRHLAVWHHAKQQTNERPERRIMQQGNHSWHSGAAISRVSYSRYYVMPEMSFNLFSIGHEPEDSALRNQHNKRRAKIDFSAFKKFMETLLKGYPLAVRK